MSRKHIRMGGWARRIGRVVFVVLLVGSCCTGIFHRAWTGWFIGLLTIFVLAWIAYRMIRWYVRHWRLRLFGQQVTAVILSKQSYLDTDNDTVWEYTVSVTPPLGQPFTRSYGPHMGEPGPVGTRLRARYYAPTGGLTISERTFGGFVLTLIVDLVFLAILAGCLYAIAGLSWVLYRSAL